jgi:hypothetical protein
MATCEDANGATRPAAAGGAAQGGQMDDQIMCDDCERDHQPAAVFCKQCELFYCIEHDANLHTGKRRDHTRVPADARPAQCPVHNEEATAFCMHDERFACLACVAAVPKGPCFAHHEQVKSLDDAAAAARATLQQLAQGFEQDEEGMQREVDGLTRVRELVDERLGQLQEGMRRAAEGKAKMRAAAAVQARDKLTAQLQAAQATAAELQTAIAAAVGVTAAWLAAWQQRCDAIVPYTVRRCVIV